MTSSREDKPAADATAPCMNVIGVGRTGAVYVEALLRTGEIEDLLVDPGATFAALVIDIGDDDMSLAQDYGASFTKRLEARGIPTERFLFQSISLPVPTEKELVSALGKSLKAGKAEPYLTKGFKMPKPGEHFPRAIAKAIYAGESAPGGAMDAALDKFVAQVETATSPSIVAVCCSLAGGTGTGIVVDLARQLANVKLTKDVKIIGVGQLPHTGDPDTYRDSAALYTALNDIDCLLDDEKNAALTAKYGKAFENPFTGGFFVVNPEQSWQRLTAYTTTGEARIRQAIKEMVTNRFVADSFMRWAVANKGADLLNLLRPAKKAGAPSETIAAGARNWSLFDVAKLTHPGVQVLPGEAPSKWEAVLRQWTNFMPKYDGLKDDFKTDFAHVSLYGSRNMAHGVMVEMFRDMIRSRYLLDEKAELPISVYEFFDVLTAYGNVVLLGVAKTDLKAFWSSQKTFDALSGENKLMEHSLLIEAGPMLSDPATRFDGLPSQCNADAVVPLAKVRGDELPPPNRRVAAKAA